MQFHWKSLSFILGPSSTGAWIEYVFFLFNRGALQRVSEEIRQDRAIHHHSYEHMIIGAAMSVVDPTMLVG